MGRLTARPSREGWDANNRRNRRTDSKVGMSPNRKRWVRAGNIELIFYADDTDPDNPVRDIDIRQGRMKITFRSNVMTAAEVDVIGEFLADHLGIIRKEATRHDEEARRAYEEEGDDSDPRLYREPPRVVDRARGQRPHGSVLQQRPDSVPPGDARDDGDSHDEPEGRVISDDEMDEYWPKGMERQDDAEA